MTTRTIEITPEEWQIASTALVLIRSGVNSLDELAERLQKDVNEIGGLMLRLIFLDMVTLRKSKLVFSLTPIGRDSIKLIRPATRYDRILARYHHQFEAHSHPDVAGQAG